MEVPIELQSSVLIGPPTSKVGQGEEQGYSLDTEKG